MGGRKGRGRHLVCLSERLGSAEEERSGYRARPRQPPHQPLPAPEQGKERLRPPSVAPAHCRHPKGYSGAGRPQPGFRGAAGLLGLGWAAPALGPSPPGGGRRTAVGGERPPGSPGRGAGRGRAVGPLRGPELGRGGWCDLRRGRAERTPVSGLAAVRAEPRGGEEAEAGALRGEGGLKPGAVPRVEAQ